MEAKVKRLLELYRNFEEKTRFYRQGAVCTLGCADCCINVGNVDAVTLECWIILEYMKGMDRDRRSGHLSCILMLLQQPGFRRLYLSGGDAHAQSERSLD